MNNLLWSETMSNGKPFSQYHFSKKVSVSCSAVNEENEGTIWILDPSQSVKVIIVSKPLSSGKGLMKSIATESQHASGMGNGWRGLLGDVHYRVTYCELRERQGRQYPSLYKGVVYRRHLLPYIHEDPSNYPGS